MATYRILLANLFAMRAPWEDICRAVRDLFEPALAHSTEFDNVHVRSAYTEPADFDDRLVVTVITRRNESVVQRRFHFTPPGNHDGYTYWVGDEAVSEVYFANLITTRTQAGLIYHEALHNVLRRDNSLHALGGYAASPIDPGDAAANAAVSAELGPALDNTPRQWHGGFAWSRGIARDAESLESFDPSDIL